MHSRNLDQRLHLAFDFIGYKNAPSTAERHLRVRPAKMIDTDQARWFLRIFEAGKKLDTLTIRELYLSGYIRIELNSPGKEPLPTSITENGKRVLET